MLVLSHLFMLDYIDAVSLYCMPDYVVAVYLSLLDYAVFFFYYFRIIHVGSVSLRLV